MVYGSHCCSYWLSHNHLGQEPHAESFVEILFRCVVAVGRCTWPCPYRWGTRIQFRLLWAETLASRFELRCHRSFCALAKGKGREVDPACEGVNAGAHRPYASRGQGQHEVPWSRDSLCRKCSCDSFRRVSEYVGVWQRHEAARSFDRARFRKP